MGRLAGALNAMLTQIEAAFAARAASEARALESQAQAVRSEERMREFVADASHELRTPLTTIRGFAELYRQGAAGGPEAVGPLLRRIEDEAARMGLLVEDLLLLARLDQERPLTLAPVDLREWPPTRSRQPRRSPRTASRPRPGRRTGRLVVIGDEPRLRQVVSNLMTNALTHTPGRPPVTLRLASDGRRRGARGDRRRTGAGTGAGRRVFERFYRVDKARTRQAAAASPAQRRRLGLAIVQALVAAHQGSVTVDSVPGTGTTFRVRLPLSASA